MISPIVDVPPIDNEPSLQRALCNGDTIAESGPVIRFVDLFAGLGGFHVGLSRLGCECVFASELDSDLRKIYEENFALRPCGDIRKVKAKDIPAHDILCAGFPCQPFSKAGEQLGLDCEESGDLFRRIIKIARFHKPRLILLENVANLPKHDNGRTWEKRFRRRLENAGYNVTEKELSPHQFGIPQIRPRFFVVATLDSLDGFEWPEPQTDLSDLSIRTVLEQDPTDARKLSELHQEAINVWQEFIDAFPSDEELPSFPIWSMEFGATYPYEDSTPFNSTSQLLSRRKGSHGVPLNQFSPEERFEYLPSHARVKSDKFPDWKIRFIEQNRELYRKNKDWIDCWLPKILKFPSSLQKLEWNCKGEVRELSRYILQLRASGIRVKRPTTAPALVAMTTSQVPIIGWESRYMTAKECSRLQSLDELSSLPSNTCAVFKALGNAVNAELVRLIAERCITHLQNGSSTLNAKSRLKTVTSTEPV